MFLEISRCENQELSFKKLYRFLNLIYLFRADIKLGWKSLMHLQFLYLQLIFAQISNSFKSWIYSSMGKWLSYFGLTNKCSKRPALNNINAMSPYNEMNEFHEQAHVALAGLYNLGNTCYFNSALQVIFDTIPAWFMNNFRLRIY